MYISAVTKDDDVVVWERDSDGNRIEQHYPAPFYFYVDDPLLGEFTTVYGTKVSKVVAKSQRELGKKKREYEDKRVGIWESDITPDARILSNHYFNIPAPKLHVTFYDIEVDYDPEIGFSTIENPYAPINSVALLHEWLKEFVVIVVPPEEGWTEERLAAEVASAAKDAPISSEFTTRYIVCQNEKELLMNLIIEFEDSDALSGWNSDFFDLPYIAQRISRTLDGERLNLKTTLIEGYNGKPKLAYDENPNVIISKPNKCKWLKRLDFPHYGMPSFSAVPTQQGKLMGHKVELVGRVHFDYMVLFKKYEPGEKQSYKLSSISELVLVDDKTKESLLPKLEYEGSLADLYRKNFAFFVRYNIRDTEILYGFEKKLGYVELANQMYHLSTGLASQVTGTLKLAELALVNYCHHTLKRVVNNVREPLVDRQIDGALVLLPQAGMHENFGSIDINSLYPSAIRSLNISPEMIRGQFQNCFADAQEIALSSYKMLTFKFESNGKEETRTAEEWRDYFIEMKWAISGYGTAFCQKQQGFIPALLQDWYATRKKYQKLKVEAQDAGDYELSGYYDRLQYVYKIKLNSLYGALTNLYFRFYDLRMGESTTGSVV
jgi:DNA polymerase elongation subunit (family B)